MRQIIKQPEFVAKWLNIQAHVCSNLAEQYELGFYNYGIPIKSKPFWFYKEK